jgi:hypothetical protein
MQIQPRLTMLRCVPFQEGDSVIIDVDADGQVTVLNGDKKMVRSAAGCGL